MDLSIFFDLLVLCLVGGLIYWIITVLPLPEPFRTIAVVIVLVFLLLALLSFLFNGGVGFYHLGRLR